ncbi:MAG TPA: helix-turn-helix domain-containing protein [Rhodothermales bacterium]|nr:helix-turn-helix domain-containing protein [Rhodothermales bacterium]
MKKGTFVLSESDATEIASILAEGNLSHRLAMRCQCLTLLASGKSQKEVAEITGFNPNTISSWYRRYQFGTEDTKVRV